MTIESGCHLDGHRGHYIFRDVIQLAAEHGYIVDSFASYALTMYEDHSHRDDFPCEAVIELTEEAINWLNSGQDECAECCRGSHGSGWPGPGYEWDNAANTDPDGIVLGGAWVICRACSASGRGPRIPGQNFPPKLPADHQWGWNDGDFGLYPNDFGD